MTQHVGDYIKLTGKPLGRTTDQTTEAAHQYLNKRMTLSKYYIKDIQSHRHGLKLYQSILHLNSYNI